MRARRYNIDIRRRRRADNGYEWVAAIPTEVSLVASESNAMCS